MANSKEKGNYGDSIWIKNGYVLRRVIGILGMTLPIILYVSLWLFSGYKKVLPSISHYYFTRADGVFIIIVGIMAIFLIVYEGKAETKLNKSPDFWWSTVAGVAAILLLLFPTSTLVSIFPDSNIPYSNTIIADNTLREKFHFISAGIFLISLAYISIFIFTKSNKPKGQRGKMKNLRNLIYKTCGILMIVALIVIGFKPFGIDNITFWMESVAIFLFGFSWLIKGDALFGDGTK